MHFKFLNPICVLSGVILATEVGSGRDALGFYLVGTLWASAWPRCSRLSGLQSKSNLFIVVTSSYYFKSIQKDLKKLPMEEFLDTFKVHEIKLKEDKG
ncbi:hypothetical protein CR513_31347, partial [Mucuna pruriens]